MAFHMIKTEKLESNHKQLKSECDAKQLTIEELTNQILVFKNERGSSTS